MAITDARVIRLTNEQTRVLAEDIRAIKARLDAYILAYTPLAAAGLIPNDAAQALEDGREAEGVSRLTGQDLVRFRNVVNDLKTTMDAVGIAAILDKPCVRPLQAS